MEYGPPPPGGDVNRGPALLACIWAPFPFTVFLLVSRIYVRWRINGVGIDDYLMIASWILYTATFATETVNILHGSTRHVYYLVIPDQIEFVLKLQWISQPIGIMAATFGKCSVAFLIRRIVGAGTHDPWRKWLLYVNTALYLLASIVCSFLAFCQCKPADDIWTQIPGAQCWNQDIDVDFVLFQSAYGAALDFFLALLPVTIIWGLHLSFGKRVATCILLGLGVFAGICACIKTAIIRSPTYATDFTWATFDIWVWTSLEMALVIICGSIPTLKPLWDQLFNGKAMASHRGNQYPSNQKAYATRSAGSNRSGASRFNNFSKNSSSMDSSSYSRADHDTYPIQKDIRVQQDIYVQMYDRNAQSQRQK